jgi:hypothetical protein
MTEGAAPKRRGQERNMATKWKVMGMREMSKDELVRMTPGRAGLVFRVRSGSLYVTQEGDLEDHLLGQGDELRLSGSGVVVAWALAPTSLVVTEAAPVLGTALLKSIHRLSWGLNA